MHNAAILAGENEGLRAANERQKRKQAKQRSYITTERVLTVEEGIRRVEQRDTDVNRGIESGPLEVKQREPRSCSKCNLYNRTACTC